MADSAMHRRFARVSKGFLPRFSPPCLPGYQSGSDSTSAKNFDKAALPGQPPPTSTTNLLLSNLTWARNLCGRGLSRASGQGGADDGGFKGKGHGQHVRSAQGELVTFSTRFAIQSSCARPACNSLLTSRSARALACCQADRRPTGAWSQASRNAIAESDLNHC